MSGSVLRFHLRAGLAAAALAFAAAGPASAEIVTVMSGNGSVGGTDSQVHYLLGPQANAFTTAFTSSNFTSAQTGPSAFIVTPNGAWIPSLVENPSAKWVSTEADGGTNQGSTALYAINFTLTQPVTTASLVLNFAADDTLGGGPNQGVYINGTAISGNSSIGTYGSETTISRTDIGTLLHVGANTLYINSTNLGGPAGLLFSATITTSAVPEPGSLALLGVAGVVGVIAARRNRGRRSQA